MSEQPAASRIRVGAPADGFQARAQQPIGELTNWELSAFSVPRVPLPGGPSDVTSAFRLPLMTF